MHLERPPRPPAEPPSSKNEKPVPPDWWEYESKLTEHVSNNEAKALEEQLLQEHPLLPGEREAFNWLLKHKDELGHEPKLKLDDSGLHVVPNDHTAA